MSGSNWNSNSANYVVIPTYVPRMHPSRTRALGFPDPNAYTKMQDEHAPEHASEHASGNKMAAKRAQEKEKICCACVSVPNLEAFSAICSVVALGFAIYFATKTKLNPEFPLWWSDITVVNLTDANKMQAVGDFSNAWQATCSQNRADFVNGTAFRLQNIDLQLLPATRRIEMGFRPLYALIWIFFFSFVMQLSRSRHALIVEFFGYDATAKVEFTRWLEYALTSPLQIWIVASLFFVGDIMTLISLAAAQLGLVLLGALIEYFNGRARKKASKNKNEKAKAAYHSAYATLFLAWVIHFLIWLPLYLRFKYQIDKSDKCVEGELEDNWNEARFYVQLTFYAQFGLFSAFGGCLSYVTFFENENKDQSSRWSYRCGVSAFYAVLSVTAKVALDFGFLMIIFIRAREPES